MIDLAELWDPDDPSGSETRLRAALAAFGEADPCGDEELALLGP